MRQVTIFSGQRFEVPQGIQRIDSASTHGWQVRYHGTKLFSDGSGDGRGADRALRAAVRELLRRIATQPAPVTLQRAPSAHKTSDLPPGISGPIVRTRQGGGARSAVLAVVLPRWGVTPQVKNVHIGTENTYSAERYHAALERAVALRQEAESRYRRDATRARRRAASALRASLRAAQGPAR